MDSKHSPFQRDLTPLVRQIVLHRRKVLFLLGLISLLAAWISLRLQFDFTPQALFAGQDDLVEFSEQTKRTFGHSDNIMLVIQTCTGDESSNPLGMLTPQGLNWHVQVCKQLITLPGVERIDALATIRMPRPRLFRRVSMIMVPVIVSTPLDAEKAELVRRKIDAQPLLNGALISEDRRTLAIVLHLDPSKKDYVHLNETASQIEKALQKAPTPTGYDMFLGGLPAMRVEIVNNLQKDQLFIIPICLFAFALIELVIFRCWAGLLIPAIAVLMGLTWTLAAMVLLNQPLTILSNILPVLLMIVGVSTCVHFLSAYAEQSEIYPGDRLRAVVETVRHIGLACFLTSFTTALGFLSLLFAHSQLLGALGWQAAMGIGFYFVATLGCCATLSPYFRAPRASHLRNQSPHPSASPLARWAWATGRLALAFPRLTLGGGLLVILGAILVGQHIKIDSRLAETFDSSNPQVARMELIEDQLGGFMPIEVVLTAQASPGESEGKEFQKADTWRRLVAMDHFIDHRDEVLFSRSLVDLYYQVDQLLPGGPVLEPLSEVNLEITGSQRDQLEKRLQEIHYALQGKAKATGYSSFLSDDRMQTRLVYRMRDHGTHLDIQFGEALKEQLASLFPPGCGIEFQITGEAYVAAVALNRFIRDLFLSLAGVSLFIFVVIGALLRSPRLGLLSILPNITPLAITMGYLGLRGYSLSMSNVIVFAISLGVAVDDTIHFLVRFREERRVGQRQSETDVSLAIQRTCLGTGRAIFMTTILIVCGLAILLLSAFVPTRRFAELSTVTMISALLGDLLLLPASIKLFGSSLKFDEKPQA